jgi:hypothetical protein
MANFSGRLALHDQKPEAVAVIKLATSPLVLTTFALRACDAGRPLISFRADVSFLEESGKMYRMNSMRVPRDLERRLSGRFSLAPNRP